MPKFIITGGRRLSGEIKINGAKNAALKIIPAAILSEQTITVNNLPGIEDIGKSFDLLTDLGAKITHRGSSAEIDTKNINKTELSSKLADKFRTSVMFVGPLLARFGEVSFPHPGGCVIGAGSRPIDLFLEGFKAFGATVEEEDGKCYRVKGKKLQGTTYFFSTVSVTVTESLMMTACLIPGETILKNCAMEPEIKALADYLNEQGAKISGAGTPIIKIEGVTELSAGTFDIIPDRIETGSFALLAAATNSEIKITACNPDHILSLLTVFDKIGVKYEEGADWLLMKPSKNIRSYNIKTHEYPGFPTDLQSPYAVLMTQAHGLSLIQETIYDRRLIWTDMLSQMGANIIMCDPHRVVISGPTGLHGKKLISPDIRAGIALVIAALIADGTTEIDNIYQLDRGYEKLDERLKKLGADIQRLD
ncbi:TPA: UDP-N-acetylglucosamine 1-carboxyvinyltransferase [Candidatus Falkowbacteria bacterium]|nr:MAG: MurA: UDP-N-acetylglucosamine 1-carboxyvinyltransferase [Candidatus Falkowbacteria bacterium GW2011_GWF2_43_32]HBA36332.1 UDP-N-acetylglucosamine 1-carboxyvinyltransferase [Candidatus Falkowbacteria bacterium]